MRSRNMVYHNHGLVQGVDIQADGSDTMEVGEGSARQFNTTVTEVSALLLRFVFFSFNGCISLRNA